MNPCIPMQQTLRDMIAALESDNYTAVTYAASRLVAPVGAIYSTPRPTTPHAQKSEDRICGPVVLLIHRALDVIGRKAVHAGLRGVPWDGTWLRLLLEFILAIIEATKLPGASAGAAGGAGAADVTADAHAPGEPSHGL